MKLYHLPSDSVLRGGRVVQDTDNIVSGRSRILFTSVDLPEPEGPETITTSGLLAPSIIPDFVPVPGAFRSPFSFPDRAASFPTLRLPFRESLKAKYWLRAASPEAESRASCPFPRDHRE